MTLISSSISHPTERSKTQTEPEQFWALVKQTEGCWLWGGKIHATGYGLMYFSGRNWYAHRLAYTLVNGPIPTGLHVCHHCDTPVCVRVDHLFVGTMADNIHDRDIKGRGRTEHLRTSSRLTTAQVTTIRQRWETERITKIALGREFGVSSQTIRRVVESKDQHAESEGR